MRSPPGRSQCRAQSQIPGSKSQRAAWLGDPPGTLASVRCRAGLRAGGRAVTLIHTHQGWCIEYARGTPAALVPSQVLLCWPLPRCCERLCHTPLAVPSCSQLAACTLFSITAEAGGREGEEREALTFSNGGSQSVHEPWERLAGG